MNIIRTQFKIKIDHMIDSLASNGIRLIRPKETNLEDLAGLEWKIKPMREETRIMIPSDYSTFQNRDNLSVKFRDYKEETLQESESEMDMLNIESDDEPED